MAESTLSLGYDEIQIEVGRYLGYEADYTEWSLLEVAEVNRIIQAGYRQFLYPQAMEGVEAGYEWSFLKPTTTITTIKRYETGDIAIVAGTCTLVGGTWPTWAATHGTLVCNDVEYSVTARDIGGLEITVVGDDDTADEGEWYLKHAGYQDLPDGFGRVIGDLNYKSSECSISVPIVSEYEIRMMLQQSEDEGRPQYAAVRFKDDTGTGQRQEIVWWPIPNDVYVLTYRYEAFTGEIATGEYAVGGMKHSEVITESCLAIAEQRLNDEKGIHWDNFSRLLVAAVAQDEKNGARYFGPMGSSGLGAESSPYNRYIGDYYPITYKGSTW